MDTHHRQSLHLRFFTLIFMIFMVCGSTCAQSPADYGRTWQDLPVIPEFSDNAREILKAGIAAGHNPHAFSKVETATPQLPGIFPTMTATRFTMISGNIKICRE